MQMSDKNENTDKGHRCQSHFRSLVIQLISSGIYAFDAHPHEFTCTGSWVMTTKSAQGRTDCRASAGGNVVRAFRIMF